MLQFGTCPRCGAEIDHERFMASGVVCRCGWSHSTQSAAAQKRSANRIMVRMILAAVFIIGTFIQVVNWNSHFISIIPLKVKQLIGVASVPDLERIATICYER